MTCEPWLNEEDFIKDVAEHYRRLVVYLIKTDKMTADEINEVIKR